MVRGLQVQFPRENQAPLPCMQMIRSIRSDGAIWCVGFDRFGPAMPCLGFRLQGICAARPPLPRPHQARHRQVLHRVLHHLLPLVLHRLLPLLRVRQRPLRACRLPRRPCPHPAPGDPSLRSLGSRLRWLGRGLLWRVLLPPRARLNLYPPRGLVSQLLWLPVNPPDDRSLRGRWRGSLSRGGSGLPSAGVQPVFQPPAPRPFQPLQQPSRQSGPPAYMPATFPQQLPAYQQPPPFYAPPVFNPSGQFQQQTAYPSF
jgi:hypothetical protein